MTGPADAPPAGPPTDMKETHMTANDLAECWVTVAVTPLPPGWTNTYRMNNGEVLECPSPAVLLQELRETEHFTRTGDRPPYNVETRTERHTSPYDTRAVFADIEYGQLVPAADADNYAGTVPTSEVTREVIR